MKDTAKRSPHIATPIREPLGAASVATPEATFQYRGQFTEEFERAYFRRADDLTVSSVALGTRPGAPTTAVDRNYESIVQRGVESGCNVIDAALAERHQRSQRAVGRALAATDIPRESVFLMTSVGTVPFDGIQPENLEEHVRRVYVEPGLLDWDDLVHGSHALAPSFIDDQIDRSLSNLGVERLDGCFLETPEVQLDGRSPTAVYDALEAAFEVLERRSMAGDVGGYGVSTWDGLRVPSDHDRYLSFPEIVSRARRAASTVGATGTSLNFIQLPFNVTMADAFTVAAHEGPDGRQSALWFAADAGLDVFTTAPLAGGHLADGESIPDAVAERVAGESPAQKAINFARSAPGVVATVVGCRTEEHFVENIDAGRYPPLGADAFDATFA